jgi:hypothetical protein
MHVNLQIAGNVRSQHVPLMSRSFEAGDPLAWTYVGGRGETCYMCGLSYLQRFTTVD